MKTKELLMAEALAMGLNPHHALGVKKLQEMIDEALGDIETSDKQAFKLVDEQVADTVVEPKIDNELLAEQEKFQKAEPVSVNVTIEDPAEKAKKIAKDIAVHKRLARKRQLELVRVIIRCNNDTKKDLEGEIKTVICLAGTVKRYIPFDNEKGWHIERVIFDSMKESMCQRFKSEKLKNGQANSKSYMVREYTIEELDPLMPSDIEELKQEQAARGSID